MSLVGDHAIELLRRSRGALSNGVTRSRRWIGWTRFLLVGGYLGFVALGFVWDWQPRLFWTVLLPLLPISIVLMGFPAWRRICPLAFFGEIGRWFHRGNQRRVPAWLERWFFVVTFTLMLAMLVLRLVATNGDGVWLGVLLIVLALSAALTNFVFTGKTWCNFVCPVGLIERIYTEPGSLVRSGSNSQCARCTACKRYCPDIDQENGYWRELSNKGRRLATFAFPGLVLAFYTYYWLRHGDWEAYFDGRWTRAPADSELLLGPGFFFLDAVPAVVAATLALLLFSAVSYGVFVLCEAVLGRFVADTERARHLTLALAAFTAFTIFYLFAGAPTLRELPGGTRTAAFVAPVVATLALTKRWRRRREHYIRERGASQLLRHWPFAEPPPKDPDEVYAWIKASDHAREKQLAAYSNTVREILAEGVIQGGELRFLEEVRKQLGISVREHEQVIARLSEEERELFTQERGGVELRAQLKGYQTALTEALLRHAPERELVELRQAFGVTEEAHQSVMERLRRDSGPLLKKARGQIEQALTIHRDIATLGVDGLDAKSFLVRLLRRARDSAIYRAAELLTVVGEEDHFDSLRIRFVGDDREARAAAVRLLMRKFTGDGDLVRELQSLLVEPAPASTPPDADVLTDLLRRHASAVDPYLRAASLWTAAKEIGIPAGPMFSDALNDPNELVRDTAVRAARHILELAETQLAAHEGEPLGPSTSPSPQTRRVDRKATHVLADLWNAIGPESEAQFSSLSIIERMQFLQCVPLFSGVDPEDLHELSLIADERTITPPEVLCEEGDTESDDLFILVEGQASVVVHGKAGSEIEHEVAVLDPGAVVGELSLLDGGPRSATVRPKDGSLRVLRIASEHFRARLLHRQRVTNPLLTNMAGVIRRLLDRTASARDRS